jgi:hypothetical protein
MVSIQERVIVARVWYLFTMIFKAFQMQRTLLSRQSDLKLRIPFGNDRDNLWVHTFQKSYIL